MSDTSHSGAENSAAAAARRHLRFGWWSLLVFLSLGLVLEALHGFKIQWYMNVANQTRRDMWTLAHAHGTLLGLIHIAFGATAHFLPAPGSRSQRLASPCLTAATVLLPTGFFLGGIFIHAGDPGLGILLVPIGGVLLVAAVFLIARGLTTGGAGTSGRSTDKRSSRKTKDRR